MAIQLSEYIALNLPYALLRATLGTTGQGWSAIETEVGFPSYAVLNANIHAVVIAPDSIWPILEITGTSLTGLVTDNRIVNRGLASVGHPLVVPVWCKDPASTVAFTKTNMTYAWAGLPFDPEAAAFASYWDASAAGVFSQAQRVVAQVWFKPPPYSMLQTKRYNWTGYRSTTGTGALQTIAKVPFFGRAKCSLFLTGPAGSTVNIYGRKFQGTTTGDAYLITSEVFPASGMVTIDIVDRAFDAIEVTSDFPSGTIEVYAEAADAA